MINAEKFKDELKELNDADKLWHTAFDKHNMTFCDCIDVKCENCTFNGYKFCNNGRYNWLLSEYKKPIILTELEYNILKYLAYNTEYMYIARDKSDFLGIYHNKPDKLNNAWSCYGRTGHLNVFDELFQFVKWEDEEPYSINDILKNCRVISDNIVINKIVDE